MQAFGKENVKTLSIEEFHCSRHMRKAPMIFASL
jgi:hypothetical protein